MRSYVPEFKMRPARNFKEALRMLKHGEWRPFAGGTDLMVLFEAGNLTHAKYLSLQGLKELKGIRVKKDNVDIGAMTTYREIQESAALLKEFPLLAKAAEVTGAVAIQNRGTLGGNIANASPAADSLAVLLIYGASLLLASHQGSRWLDYAEFHTGYKKTLLEPGEIIQTIRLPRGRARWRQYYRKVGTRNAQAISKVVFAGMADTSRNHLNDIRIALGSVAPTVIRTYETERFMKLGDWPLARERFVDELRPIDDLRSTAAFRRQVALNVFDEFLEFIGCRIG